jgi:hypothetical protein
MASTIKVNSIEAQSSTDINIPTGYKLKVADTGELYIGGVAITTGAQGVISKTATYPIVPGDFTGKSSLIVFVDVSAGTSTETIITLPAEADFSTCAIHVVSTAAHGAGNKITIKNDTPTEMYTLYEKGDHCEFVSDGTNVFRTGNEWVTVTGRAFNNVEANPTFAANAITRCFSTYVTTDYNVGSWWDDVTNYRITAGFDCDIEIHAQHTGYNSNGMMPVLKHLDSSAVLQQWYNYPRATDAGGYYLSGIENTFVVRNMSATDYLEFYNSNNHSSSQYFTGDTDGTGACFDFRVLRRH